jgi:hypothetical protein
MALGKKTGGRKRGVPNKLTTGAKEVIAQVAANIGGVARMTEWVRKGAENERAFWTNIYPKLLPLQVAGDRDNPLTMINRIERVIVERPAPPDDTVLSPPTIHEEASKSTSSPRPHWSD